MKLLRFEEIKLISIVKRNCAYVLCRLLTRLLKLSGLPSLIQYYFELTIKKQLAGLNRKHAFSLNAVFARPVVHQFWLNHCPSSLLLNRVHDWVELNDYQVYIADNFIASGNWSSLLTDIRTSSVYKEAQQIQQYQADFRQSPLYKSYANQLAQGRKIVRNKSDIDTVDKLDQYFLRYEALFASIHTYGLLTLKEAHAKVKNLNHVSAIRRWQASWTETEIGVAIGPNGEVATLPGGKHRLSIAAMLGIQSTKAQVRMVHVDWLARISKAEGQSWSDAIKIALENMDKQFLNAANQ